MKDGSEGKDSPGKCFSIFLCVCVRGVGWWVQYLYSNMDLSIFLGSVLNFHVDKTIFILKSFFSCCFFYLNGKEYDPFRNIIL